MFEPMKEIGIILSCTWKFALTFPMAVYVAQMSFIETLVFTNIGGIIGVLFFAFLSGQIIRLWNRFVGEKIDVNRKPKPVFTKRKRKFIKLKTRYGFIGIVVLNPVVISIPISTFLVKKYYGRVRFALLWLILGQIAWSFIYTYFYIYIKQTI